MQTTFRIGDWLVDPQTDQIAGPQETVHIEPRAMQVLVYLADHAGEVVTRDEILHAVWDETFVADEVLTSAIAKLRRAFGDEGIDPRFVQTVPQKGYRLNASVSPAPPSSRAASKGESYNLEVLRWGRGPKATRSPTVAMRRWEPPSMASDSPCQTGRAFR